tara:strand:+ start:371 stop:487 length:117 start_codon:yes stop_codon:yes gene_type:complete
MRECVSRKCNQIAMKGFRRCIYCIKGIKPLEVIKEEEE